MTNNRSLIRTFNVPNQLIDLHEAVSTKIVNSRIGVECSIYYPALKEDCPNCEYNPITQKSANIYASGGPVIFDTGFDCPYCNGEGFIFTETFDIIKMKVYWQPKDWTDIGFDVEKQEGIIQTQAFVADLPKIQRSSYMVPNLRTEQAVQYKYSLIKESVPHGFRQDKFFISFWERV